MQAIAQQILKFSQQLLRHFGKNFSQVPAKILGTLVAIALVGCLGACSGDSSTISSNSPAPNNLTPVKLAQSPKITISEVSPPATIQKLSRYFDTFAPQVKILEPKPDEILTDTKVSIKFAVKDLPIFKNSDLGLGTHIHVILDNQEYKASYDLNQPFVFENLAAGTHTIRAFVSRPWHESFKNEGAFAQTTFHVYTKTLENIPSPQLPLLTYSRPVGTYGAEPVMLDFYLTNTPLHAALLDEAPTTDWQIRVTVNDQSFIVDQWLPVYIKGLNIGLNWVKLEFLDAEGHLVTNQFNNTAHLINYQPGGTDTLSRLVRGEVISNVEAIVNPNYKSELLGTEPQQPETQPIKPEPKQKKSAPELVKQLPSKVEESSSIPKTTSEPIELQTPAIPEKPLNTPTAVQTTPKPQIVEPIKINTPKLLPTVAPTPVKAVTKLKIIEPTDTEISKPVEQIAEPSPLEPATTAIEKPQSPKIEPIEAPKIDVKIDPDASTPKVLKGLDNLNLGERLKQSRQKQAIADEDSSELKPE